MGVTAPPTVPSGTSGVEYFIRDFSFDTTLGMYSLAINFSTGSGQSDTITLSDLENNSKTTTFTDTFVPTESIELLYEIFLHVADAVVPVDSFSISQNLGRYYSDTIVLIDSINFDTDSNQYDVITLTDSLTSYSFRGAFFTDALSRKSTFTDPTLPIKIYSSFMLFSELR